jgi:hypothetical protein
MCDLLEPLLSESCRTSAHDFALANELGVEFGTVEGEVDVEVHAVESTLRRVHALEVLLEVLAAEVGGECDDFLDA